MSIILNRVWRKFPVTEMALISKESKKVNFKPVKAIVARFDPFHDKVKSIRDFLIFNTGYRHIVTNPQINISTNIVCDRSEPVLTFELASGNSVVLKTQNLSHLDILQLYNKHITSTIPIEEPTDKKIEITKKQKKKGF